LGEYWFYLDSPKRINLKKFLKPKKILAFFGKRIDFFVFNVTIKLSSFETIGNDFIKRR